MKNFNQNIKISVPRLEPKTSRIVSMSVWWQFEMRTVVRGCELNRLCTVVPKLWLRSSEKILIRWGPSLLGLWQDTVQSGPRVHIWWHGWLVVYSCSFHLEHRPSVKRFVSLQFLNRKTVGTTPWTGDQLVARPLPANTE
jgi:hypothetical protein